MRCTVRQTDSRQYENKQLWLLAGWKFRSPSSPSAPLFCSQHNGLRLGRWLAVVEPYILQHVRAFTSIFTCYLLDDACIVISFHCSQFRLQTSMSSSSSSIIIWIWCIGLFRNTKNSTKTYTYMTDRQTNTKQAARYQKTPRKDKKNAKREKRKMPENKQ